MPRLWLKCALLVEPTGRFPPDRCVIDAPNESLLLEIGKFSFKLRRGKLDAVCLLGLKTEDGATTGLVENTGLVFTPEDPSTVPVTNPVEAKGLGLEFELPGL